MRLEDPSFAGKSPLCAVPLRWRQKHIDNFHCVLIQQRPIWRRRLLPSRGACFHHSDHRHSYPYFPPNTTGRHTYTKTENAKTFPRERTKINVKTESAQYGGQPNYEPNLSTENSDNTGKNRMNFKSILRGCFYSPEAGFRTLVNVSTTLA